MAASVTFLALGWGVGPALLGTLVGALALDYVAIAPYWSWSLTKTNLVGVVLVVVVGLAASVGTSQIARAREAAENLAIEAEQARRDAEALRARLDAVIEAVPDLLTIHDATGRMVRLNSAARRDAGDWRGHESLQELAGAYGILSVDGQPIPIDALPVARALRGETVAGVEVREPDVEGCTRYLLTSAAPFRDRDGQVEGVVAIAHDVTALRSAERSAAARASQLRATFEAMVDGVFVYDRGGHIVQANHAVQVLFGLQEGDDFLALGPEERADMIALRDEAGQVLAHAALPTTRLLAGETLIEPHSLNVALRTRDGRERIMSVSGAPVRDDTGQITGAVAVYRDITERRQLEQRTQQALGALLEMAQALVLVPTRDDAPRKEPASATSAVMRRLAELTCSVLGCARASICALDPQTDTLQPLAIFGLPPEQEQLWWQTRQGARLSDSIGASAAARLQVDDALVLDLTEPPLRELANLYDTRTAVLAPMRIGARLIGVLALDYGDTTRQPTTEATALARAVARLTALVVERERLLCEREQARTDELALREANRRMDEFLGIASHELKTPVASIKLNAQLAERQLRGLVDASASVPVELTAKIDAVCGLLGRSDRSLTRLGRLVDDLLDVSRIRAGKLALRSGLADLAVVVRDVVEEQRAAAPHRTIHLDMPPGAAVPVFADADRIGQVVTNYLTNALKYSQASLPVHVQLVLAGAWARVHVRDEGPGLPAEEHGRIWEMFHRVDGIEVQSGSGVGLGLGLHISQTIIERHGGQVGVESAPGQGSTFWFTLPLASASVG
jgi:PAS domain S-box-containing protein